MEARLETPGRTMFLHRGNVLRERLREALIHPRDRIGEQRKHKEREFRNNLRVLGQELGISSMPLVNWLASDLADCWEQMERLKEDVR